MIEAKSDCDVLVVGAGTAGSIAAIQAARAGVRTMLVESSGCPGGTVTSGIACPGIFHAWGKQIIAGIGWEMLLKTLQLGNHTLPDFSDIHAPHWKHQIAMDGGTYACILEETFQEAGVDVHYCEMLVSGHQTENGWEVLCMGKGPVYHTISCRVIIDATGDADVTAILGYARERGDKCQPGTLCMSFAGYEPDTLDADLIQTEYRKAMADGRLQPGDIWGVDAPFIGFLKARGQNAQHVFDADSTTATSKSSTNIRGRESALRLLRFIRSLPGCENAYLADMQHDTCVRETYRIIGETTITVEDYVSGRFYPDAVCYAFYPVDLHTDDGVEPEKLAEGVVPTIPLSALIPKSSTSVLVAGRCVSSDRLANSALRVQASCMAMGQSAGAAAALAVNTGKNLNQIDLTMLHSLLEKHGAIVPRR